MVTRVYHGSEGAYTQDDVNARAAQADHAARQDGGVQAKVHYGALRVIHHSDGSTETHVPNAVSRAYAADPRAGVTINGVNMTREQAIQHGFIAPDFHDGKSAPAHAVATTPKAATDTAAVAPGDNAADAPQQDDAPDITAKGEDGRYVDATLDAGQKELDAFREAQGKEAADALIAQAVDTGDLTPPEGFTAPQVDTVVKAYQHFGNDMIKDTGVTVQDMSDVLDPDTLREARKAVLAGDADKLKAIAAQTADTLAALPKSDPKGFQSFLADRFPDLHSEVRNGRTLVSVSFDGKPARLMPWDEIVHRGWLKNAKLERMPD